MKYSMQQHGDEREREEETNKEGKERTKF